MVFPTALNLIIKVNIDHFHQAGYLTYIDIELTMGFVQWEWDVGVMTVLGVNVVLTFPRGDRI